jgi:2-polyprenyl-3-methyl-5-hydroxy-6-metoxy-1,4-benzoquinol methylase
MKICRICDSEYLHEVSDCSKDYLTGNNFFLYKCDKCNIILTDPIPGNLSEYYDNNYRKYNKFTMSILSYLYKKRTNKWMKYFKNKGKVLEIGCGNGMMLNEFQINGWDVTGVERNINVSNNAELNYGIKLYTPDIFVIPDDEKYDLIILFQVLEHVDKIDPLLNKLQSLLSYKGKLIIGVPNISSWQYKFGKNYWLHLDVPRHLQHFNTNTLSTLLSRYNFNVQTTSMISYEHDPFGWVQTILNKITGTHNILLLNLMNIRKNNFIFLIHFILGILLIIPSLILSVVSWIFKSGSNIEIIAIKN